MSDILERIAHLSSEKRALLEAMLAKESKTRDLTTIPRRNNSHAPLSYAQQRIWFLDQMDPGNSAYNVPSAMRLSGQLDLPALLKSLEEIVRRHESLRTVFSVLDGQAVQIVQAPEGWTWSLIDLSELEPGEREAEALKLAKQDPACPFDLAHGPLLRTRLICLTPHEHILLLTMHHIVSDGWSLGVFIRELSTLYEAFSGGQTSPLEELSIQYADYTQWQREQLSGAVLEQHLSYWRDELKGAPLVLELPTDRPRPNVQRTCGRSLPFAVSKKVSAELEVLSRRESTTLYMTLLAAFQTLLYRYTGQDDFLVGSAIANRNRAETEGLIGLFVNTLPQRARLSDHPTFRELLKRVSDSALDANLHQDLPFSMLVEELQPQRDLSHTPLFQVIFVFQNVPIDPLVLPGLTITPVEIEDEAAKYDLSLSMTSGAEGLSGRLVYNTDLFDESTVRGMQAQLQNLLEAIVSDPNWDISALSLTTERERHQLLYEFNEWDRHFPGATLIHETVERQAEMRPRAPAVDCEGEVLSYAELNRRANQLAHYLIRLGVGPERPVAVYLQPSLEMVISLLAILKAGGAYVPLSPACPPDRLSFMLEDTAASLLLTQESFLHLLPEKRPEAICLDSEFESIACESQENPALAVSPDNLAYVLYTSGSTGIPKGVMVTHRNVSRLFEATEDWFGFDESDVWTFFHSYAFDFSVWELWGALRYGGCVVVIPFWMSRSPETFFEHIVEKKVTVLSQTPSAFNQLMRVDESEGGGSDLALKTVVFGGEALKPGNLSGWADRRGVAKPRLINMYGITETTVHVTYHRVTEGDIGQAASSVVGRPIPDLQVHILDERLQPLPVGLAGQIYVAGTGLARGYLNRPGLTAERFIPNPFSSSGARLYQTGDQARYKEDGTIEYLGRVDQQVKIRGFRVELGEIEAALREHSAVSQCVVTVGEDSPDEKRIVAYVVPQQHQSLSVDDLRDFLKQKLPDYMLPAAFISIAAIPLTQNGKLDHSALPERDSERPKLATSFESPNTEAEKILAGIWSSLLGIDDIGINDNFFELGGDSILVIQVVARARQAGLRLTPKDLFQHQAIAELAAVVGQSMIVMSEQDLVTGAVLLTPIQQRFFELGLKKINHFNQAFLLEAGNELRPELLERVVAHLLQHHDALRMRYHHEAGSWQQTNSAGGGFDVFSVIDLSAVNKSQQAKVMERAAERLQRSLDLENGPILRVTLFEKGRKQSPCLLLAIHHLVVDGVSWRILLEDLQKAYRQLESGEEIELGIKSTSFKQWAGALKEYAQSEEIKTELDYWRQHQPDARIQPEFTRGQPAIHSSRAVTVGLTKPDTQCLLQSAAKGHKDQTIAALLVALGQSFTRWSGERPLVIDLERHGREAVLDQVDLSSTVGWFTSIFPFKLEVEENEAAALRKVQKQLEGIPRNGLGYGLLRYLSDDEETAEQLKQMPRPEVSFNYMGQLDQAVSADSLFVAARGRSGAPQDPGETRAYLLDVTASVAGGRLRVSFEYSQNLFSRARIEQLAGFYLEALKSIVIYYESSTADSITHQVTSADLTGDDLINILAEIA
jgi:fengycin family lipopeptide synthetase B